MAEAKPKFNPSLPFEAAPAPQAKPKFDPSLPFEAAQQPLKAESTAPEILNEESDISALQRTAVKNFGGSLGEQVDYLKKNNPDLEIKEWDGEIIAKKPEEKAWKRLDPQGVTSPKEALMDALDVGVDIGSGALSAAAGAAGAVPGALFGLGAGGLATGAAASGAASAGLEAVKQSIGKALGTRKEFSGTDVAVSGALGAATTGLLGAGASKKLIEKAAEKPEVVKKVLGKVMETIPADLKEETKKALTKELITEGQQGALKGVQKWVLSKWSGIPQDVLSNAVKEVPEKTIQDLAEFGLNVNPAKKYTNLEFADVLEREGLGDVAQFSADRISNAIQTAKQESGSKIQQALDSSGQLTNTSEFVKPLQDLLAKYNQQFEITQSPIFAERAKQVQQYLDQIGPGQDVPLGSLFNIKNELADIVDYTKSPAAQLREGAMSKEIRGALIETERGMNEFIRKSLPQIKDAQEEYAKHLEITRYLSPKFKDADTAIKTINNVETMRSPTLKRVLQQFEKDYKVDIMPLANAAETWRYFGRAAREPIGGGGSVKVLRGTTVGGSAGYLGGLLTGIPGAATAGLALGAGAGALASSPAAMKRVLQAEIAAGRGLGAVGNQLRAQQAGEFIRSKAGELLPAPEYTQSMLSKQAAAQSAWNLMRGEK